MTVVAALAFVLGAWSWIIISTRSPKIYEIKPVLQDILSDLASLIQNISKLLMLTNEVTQGILKSSDELDADNPKLMQVVALEDRLDLKEGQENLALDFDKIDDLDRIRLGQKVEDLKSDNKRQWFSKFFGNTENKQDLKTLINYIANFLK